MKTIIITAIILLTVACNGKEYNYYVQQDHEEKQMPLSIYDKFITKTDSGETVPSVSVEVRNQNGSLATIYSNADGSTQIPNPTTSDSNGRVTFYAAAGIYDVTATGGGDTVVYNDEGVLSPQDNVEFEDITGTGTLYNDGFFHFGRNTNWAAHSRTPASNSDSGSLRLAHGAVSVDVWDLTLAVSPPTTDKSLINLGDLDLRQRDDDTLDFLYEEIQGLRILSNGTWQAPSIADGTPSQIATQDDLGGGGGGNVNFPADTAYANITVNLNGLQTLRGLTVSDSSSLANYRSTQLDDIPATATMIDFVITFNVTNTASTTGSVTFKMMTAPDLTFSANRLTYYVTVPNGDYRISFQASAILDVNKDFEIGIVEEDSADSSTASIVSGASGSGLRILRSYN